MKNFLRCGNSSWVVLCSQEKLMSLPFVSDFNRRFAEVRPTEICRRLWIHRRFCAVLKTENAFLAFVHQSLFSKGNYRQQKCVPVLAVSKLNGFLDGQMFTGHTQIRFQGNSFSSFHTEGKKSDVTKTCVSDSCVLLLCCVVSLHKCKFQNELCRLHRARPTQDCRRGHRRLFSWNEIRYLCPFFRWWSP